MQHQRDCINIPRLKSTTINKSPRNMSPSSSSKPCPSKTTPPSQAVITDKSVFPSHNFFDWSCLVVKAPTLCTLLEDFLLTRNGNACMDEGIAMTCIPKENLDKARQCIWDMMSEEASESNQTHQHDTQKRFIAFGAACLQTFIQEAFTGPECIKGESCPEVIRALLVWSENFNAKIKETLSTDGEEVYSLLPAAVFLLLARIVLLPFGLTTSGPSITDAASFTARWWGVRCAFTLQKVLDNHANSLLSFVKAELKEMEAYLTTQPTTKTTPSEHPNLHATFHLERSTIYLYYGMEAEMKECLALAQKHSGLVWSLTGELGRRTKFQTFDTSQLIVTAISRHPAQAETPSQDTKQSPHLPPALQLDDDTLLEKVHYTNLNGASSPESALSSSTATPHKPLLHIIDQCILLGFCQNVAVKNAPNDPLTNEEMTPFVARILENPQNWMVHTMALLLRSRLESGKARTVERSVLQIQALVDQFNVTDSTATERLEYYFCISLPSRWDLERELAQKFMSIGVVRSALEIFTRLECWEDVISCYQMLERTKDAERVILEQLELRPRSPKLLCLLGDVRGDSSLYEQAWESSGGRFARAMRSLGAAYFKAGNFQACIDCYGRALALNPLFENSWFVRGCAALQLEQWDVAADAFARAVNLDYENAEAWCNLASVHIKQRRLVEAWRALKEALKHKYDSHKILENFLYTSMDIGEWEDAIFAMGRILEIRWERLKGKGQLVDVELLNMLMRTVVASHDPAESNSVRLLGKFEGLLSNVLSKVTNSPELYSVATTFYTQRRSYKKALDYKLKGYRVLLLDPDLMNSQDKFDQCSVYLLELIECYRDLGPMTEVPRMAATGGEDREVVVCPDWSYQISTLLRTLTKRACDTYEGVGSYEKLVQALEEHRASSSA